jgi:hypothetical protein
VKQVAAVCRTNLRTLTAQVPGEQPQQRSPPDAYGDPFRSTAGGPPTLIVAGPAPVRTVGHHSACLVSRPADGWRAAADDGRGDGAPRPGAEDADVWPSLTRVTLSEQRT